MRLGQKIGLIAAIALLTFAPAAWSDVDVTIDGDTAHAHVSLTDSGGITYEAEVTIAFDSPLNLTPGSLNLTAELVDPNDPAIRSRLPANVSVDPAFPMMITVEPPDFPWLFASSFEGNEDGSGDLSFLNTYEFEIHTADLEYSPDTSYRLFKAPLGERFADISDDILAGSVRARGRHGAFSQFMIVSDERCTVPVALGKIVDLDTRILAAALSDLLRGDLLRLLAKVQALLLVDIDGAIAALDELIAEIELHAGIDIANEWRAERDIVNDAGEMESLAQTLRFTLVRLQQEGIGLGCIL